MPEYTVQRCRSLSDDERIGPNAHKLTTDIVFSGPIKGICTRPGLWVERGATCQPLVYFQKPKWIKDDAAWEKFLRDVFANVRLEARDLDVLRSEVTE